MSKPLAIDLFCGLGGFTEGLLAEGYDVVGFDIERHEYGPHRYPAQLVIQDVLTLDGAQLRDADLIVASPPCQEYSYMAMPWTRARQIARALRGEDEFPDGYKGSRTVEELNALFDACFRIQREACEAAGRHIPMVVENVRGAQPWVGKARWNHGSFYLWGDVPALMPAPTRRGMKGSVGTINGSGKFREQSSWDRSSVQHAAYKSQGMNWSDQAKRGQDFTRIAGQQAGVKNPGIELGDIGFNVASARQFGHMVDGVKIERSAEDKRQHIGTKRKFASAMIAKIPEPLSRWIGRAWYPVEP